MPRNITYWHIEERNRSFYRKMHGSLIIVESSEALEISGFPGKIWIPETNEFTQISCYGCEYTKNHRVPVTSYMRLGIIHRISSGNLVCTRTGPSLCNGFRQQCKIIQYESQATIHKVFSVLQWTLSHCISIRNIVSTGTQHLYFAAQCFW